MTSLAPLYLLGALAIAGPILFHLWRRTPRGRREFSTLMFLTPSPPRVTSRSRIEHWLLLLMRAAVLCLLAIAFARPLLRTATSQEQTGVDEEYVAVLLDTSASMRQDAVWKDALRRVNEHLPSLPATSTVALYQFSDRWSEVTGFTELKRQERDVRRELVTSRLATLKPGWGATNLGEALVRTAAALQEAQAERSIPAKLRILLVSDCQSGANLDALHGFEWPSDLRVELLIPQVAALSNAGLQLVERNLDAADDVLRIRVTNSANSRKELFSVKWNAADSGGGKSVYVPPGQSRVIVPPKRPAGDAATGLLLTGDDDDFDNTLYVAPNRDDTRLVVYCGNDDPNDPDGLRFYLEGVFSASHRYQIEIAGWKDALVTAKVERPAMVVLVDPDPDSAAFVKSYLSQGGTVLIAPPNAAAAVAALKQCNLDELSISEADVKRDAMLGDIDFEHPLFAPFAESQFSDFTGIRFWKHRTLAGFEVEDRKRTSPGPEGGRVIARFDDGDPAFVEFHKAAGRVWLMTGGWHPKDSQLARSSKFPPLVFRMLEQSSGMVDRVDTASVGEELAWPPSPSEATGKGTVRRPDGITLSDFSTTTPYSGTDQPGLFSLEIGGRTRTVAVNVAPDESRTAPVPMEQLEARGVRFGSVETVQAIRQAKDRQRQLQIEELEHTQKLWRWGILVVIGILLLETWMAGRRVAVQNETTE